MRAFLLFFPSLIHNNQCASREKELCVTPHTHLLNYSVPSPSVYVFIYNEFTLFYGHHTHTHELRVIRSHHENNRHQQTHKETKTIQVDIFSYWDLFEIKECFLSCTRITFR
jgi:hypothetical protein